MEVLSALRLNLSPRRFRPSPNTFYEDESAPSSPFFMSAPTSPRGSLLREVEEMPLGEVLAAVPFDWELKPGTPKRRSTGSTGSREDGDVTDGEDPELCISPSPTGLSRQSSNVHFDFSSARFIVEEDTTHSFSHDAPIAPADQLFFHGQILPLRLPPRLQRVKHLGESDRQTIHGSFRKPVSPRSEKSPMKFMSFRGRSKSPQRRARDEEVEQKPKSPRLQAFRSLSPLRMFWRDDEVERKPKIPVLQRFRSLSPLRMLRRNEETEVKPESPRLQTFRSLSPMRTPRQDVEPELKPKSVRVRPLRPLSPLRIPRQDEEAVLKPKSVRVRPLGPLSPVRVLRRDEEAENKPKSPRLQAFRSSSPLRMPRRDEEAELKPKSVRLQTLRSLSPLRIFRRENSEVSILFSDKSVSGCDSASSSSSAFSSSSSGDENSNVGVSKEFWSSPDEKEDRGRSSLNNFLYSDKPCASPKIDVSKLSSKEVLSKVERYKASSVGLKAIPSKKDLEAAWDHNFPERKVLTPQLSRSNARSIARTPIIITPPELTKGKQRILASNTMRFGILRRCLGISTPSPRPDL